MQEPYLNSDVDTRYHLSPKRDGCLGLWGDVVYVGQSGEHRLKFKVHDFLPIAQAEAYPAIEISIVLPSNPRSILQFIQQMGLHRWIVDVASRPDLLGKPHDFLEQWRLENNQLTVIVVWYRDVPDWTIIPEVVTRLTKIADIISES